MKRFWAALGTIVLGLSLAFGSVITTRTYSTNFPLTEPLLHEGTSWINGCGTGVDWGCVSTSNNTAFGNESLTHPYGDSTAVLTGTWDQDQTVQATVFVAPVSIPSCGQEVELHLRWTTAAHSQTGYEISYSTAYGSTIIVKWLGPQGQFTILKVAPGVTVKNGDVIRATVTGNTITAYKNNVQIAQAVDGTYHGAPGIGFNYTQNPGCTTSVQKNYGLKNFSAATSKTQF